MPMETVPESLPHHITQEAARLYFEIAGQLHAVAADSEGILFALTVSPQFADRMAACGASIEDDEDDGIAEADERLSPFVESLLEPTPRQGHPVLPWAPPTIDVQPASSDADWR